MKRIYTPMPQKPPVAIRVMILLIIALIGVLIIGTIYGFARSPNASPILRLGRSGGTEQTDVRANGDIQIFSGIGQLRIPLKNSSTLILSIAFPYPSNDRTFTEELAGKIGDFRTIASEYFSNLAAENLIYLDEEAAKTEILRRYNAGLRLGKIEALYFSEMLVIDG
ncbi:MAG: hypothetical protein LBH44_11540 [Treponema sp.]|jgi:flagellar basal body-associated protein FliL|nr:hypothetical protein [Treponema sp.]